MPAVFTLLPLVILVLAVIGQFSVWIDPDRGAIRWHRRIIRRVEVALSESTDVALVNSGGTVMLRVRAGKRGGHAPMLVLNEYTKASQAPELLRTLADALERHARPKVIGSVPAELRAQATFMAAGGLAESSPLAARSRNGVRRAAGAAGDAGGATDLLP